MTLFAALAFKYLKSHPGLVLRALGRAGPASSTATGRQGPSHHDGRGGEPHGDPMPLFVETLRGEPSEGELSVIERPSGRLSNAVTRPRVEGEGLPGSESYRRGDVSLSDTPHSRHHRLDAFWTSSSDSSTSDLSAPRGTGAWGGSTIPRSDSLYLQNPKRSRAFH